MILLKVRFFERIKNIQQQQTIVFIPLLLWVQSD